MCKYIKWNNDWLCQILGTGTTIWNNSTICVFLLCVCTKIAGNRKLKWLLGRAVKIICINEDATNYWQKFSDFTFQMGFSSLFSFLWHCRWIGIGYPLALNGFLLGIISAFILQVNKSQLTTNKSSLNLSEWTIKTEGSEYLFFFSFCVA